MDRQNVYRPGFESEPTNYRHVTEITFRFSFRAFTAETTHLLLVHLKLFYFISKCCLELPFSISGWHFFCCSFLRSLFFQTSIA